MLHARTFCVTYLRKAQDGLTECSENLSIKPSKPDEKFGFAQIRDLFLEKHASLRSSLLVTRVTETNDCGATLSNVA